MQFNAVTAWAFCLVERNVQLSQRARAF